MLGIIGIPLYYVTVTLRMPGIFKNNICKTILKISKNLSAIPRVLQTTLNLNPTDSNQDYAS